MPACAEPGSHCYSVLHQSSPLHMMASVSIQQALLASVGYQSRWLQRLTQDFSSCPFSALSHAHHSHRGRWRVVAPLPTSPFMMLFHSESPLHLVLLSVTAHFQGTAGLPSILALLTLTWLVVLTFLDIQPCLELSCFSCG